MNFHHILYLDTEATQNIASRPIRQTRFLTTAEAHIVEPDVCFEIRNLNYKTLTHLAGSLVNRVACSNLNPGTRLSSNSVT